MSLSFGSKTQKSSQASQTDPWAPTIPYIKNFLSQIPNAQGATPAQTDAIHTLESQVSQGNPNTGAIMGLAHDQFGTQSQSGTVANGYDDLTRRLNPTADGANLDITENPHLQALLQQVGDDAAMRTNASFAAAGRDMSGANQMAVGKGVTQAQLPLLLNQYNLEQGRTDAAARSLFDASGTTANSVANLDAQALAQRERGIDTTKAGLEAQAYGPTQMLNLEEQLKNLPLDQLDRIANLLYPAAKLGEQSTGTAKTKQKSFGLGVNLLGGG